MKKWIVRLIILGVVVVIAAVVVFFLSLDIIVKKGVETVGPQLTKVDVKLGSAHISPFSGSGELSGLVVGNPQGYKSVSAIKVGDIKVVVALGSLRSDTIKIESINIKSPEITCEGGLSGINLKEIEKNLSGSDTSSSSGAAAPGQGGKKFYVKDIVVEGGKINVAINELGGKSVMVPLPPIHLQEVGSENMGVTAGELARQILKPILADALTAATEQMGNLGKGLGNVGKGATEQINRATKGLKGLLGN